MRPRRKYVSRHEAGHAVAALVAYRALGWPASLLREATVIESGENRGAVSWVHTYSPQSPALADLYAMNAEVTEALRSAHTLVRYRALPVPPPAPSVDAGSPPLPDPLSRVE